MAYNTQLLSDCRLADWEFFFLSILNRLHAIITKKQHTLGATEKKKCMNILKYPTHIKYLQPL